MYPSGIHTLKNAVQTLISYPFKFSRVRGEAGERGGGEGSEREDRGVRGEGRGVRGDLRFMVSSPIKHRLMVTSTSIISNSPDEFWEEAKENKK